MAKANLLINIITDIKENVIKKSVDDIKKTMNSAFSKPYEIDVDVDDTSVKKSFKDIPKGAKKAGDDAGKSFGSSFSSTAKKLIGGAAIFGVLSLGASAISGATEEFRNFNSELNNVASLGVKNIEILGPKLNELSTKTIGTTSELTSAYYDTVSAGVKGTQDELVKFVDQASKVAVAGNATTGEAVKGLTGVLNSYGLGVEETQRVSDIFFGTIKNGVVNFSEMNSSLSAVLPAASAAGIKFDELAGNIAQMTAKNVPAAQATTQLRAAIIELQKPGKTLASVMKGVTVELDGVSQQLTSDNIGAVLEKQGLTKTLQDIEKSATASGKSMTQVFSSAEAGSAALLLTGKNAASANQQLQNIQDSIKDGVSADAYEAQFRSVDNQMKLLQDNFQAGFNTIFTGLLPLVNEIIGSLLPIIQEGFSGIIPIIEDIFSGIAPLFSVLLSIIKPVIATITVSLGALVSSFQFLFDNLEYSLPIMATFGTLLVAMNANIIKNTIASKAKLVADKAVILVTKGWTIAQRALNFVLSNNPIGRIILLIGALVTGVIWAYNNFKPFKAIVDKVWESIKKFAGTVLDAVESVGKFLGLISEDEPKAPLKTTNEAIVETKENAEEMNEVLSDEKPIDTNKKLNLGLDKTKKKTKENKKLALEYFKSVTEASKEALKIADIEDEITRIKQDRKKTIQDDIESQQREINALLDQKLTLEKSLASGFITDDKGNSIKITAEERIDFEDIINDINKDLLFASKDLEKLEVTAEVNAKNTKEKARLAIKEIRRDRLELEVDLELRPQTDLIEAYKQDLIQINKDIRTAEGVELEKLINLRIQKEDDIAQIRKKLDKEAADEAAFAYNRSFDSIITNFSKSLSDNLSSLTIETQNTGALKGEIEAIEDRRSALLRGYRDGEVSAQKYNESLVELEQEKNAKILELHTSQFDLLDSLQRGLATTFRETSDLFLEQLSKQAEELAGQSDMIEKTYGLAVATVASAFGAVLAEGDVTLGKIIASAIDAAQAVLNAWAAPLLVKTSVEFPFGLGQVQFAALMAGANLLLGLAKGAIGGAHKGVYNLSERNMGKPGPGDNIPMMLKKGEAVVPAEVALTNPYIEKAVSGMGEQEYFERYILPKYLDSMGISMPSYEKMSQIEATYSKIDSEKLSVAIYRMKKESQESKLQTQLLLEISNKLSKENAELRKDMRQLRTDFASNQNVNVYGDLKLDGGDLVAAIKAKQRRTVE